MKTDFKNFYEPESSGISSSVCIELTGDSGLGSIFTGFVSKSLSRQSVALDWSRELGLLMEITGDCEEVFSILSLTEASDFMGDFTGLAWEEEDETGGDPKLLE